MSQVTISNTCMCSGWYVECFGDECPDAGVLELVDQDDEPRVCPTCGSENIEVRAPYELCDGYCYESAKEVLESEVLSAINGDDWGYVFVGGEGMGWLNKSGWRIAEASEIDQDFFSLNTEWEQVWEALGGGKAKVVMSHHNSPTGELYTIRPATLAECVTWFDAYHHCEDDSEHDVRVLDDNMVECEGCGEKIADLDDLVYHNG